MGRKRAQTVLGSPTNRRGSGARQENDKTGKSPKASVKKVLSGASSPKKTVPVALLKLGGPSAQEQKEKWAKYGKKARGASPRKVEESEEVEELETPSEGEDSIDLAL